jgi:hypothetical protein
VFIERCEDIEKSNKLLLKKMESILTGKATHESWMKRSSNQTSPSHFNSQITQGHSTISGRHRASTKRSGERTNSQLNQGSIVNYQNHIAEAEPMAEMERTHSNEGSPDISKERNKVKIHDEFGASNMLDMPK